MLTQPGSEMGYQEVRWDTDYSARFVWDPIPGHSLSFGRSPAPLGFSFCEGWLGG